jgi:signal transduction histidine kinase/DNA-binding NarL/FixJ family response regulator
MHPPLLGVALVDLLESDPRPTFVLELPVPENGTRLLACVAYTNPALSALPHILSVVRAGPCDVHLKFWDWATCRITALPWTGSSSSQSLSYLGKVWAKSVVQGKWVVIGANELPALPEVRRRSQRDGSKDSSAGILSYRTTSPAPSSTSSRRDERRSSVTTDPSLSLQEFMEAQEPFLDVINNVDWESTPLGPMEKWPERLQQTFSQVIADSRPIAIYWGPEFTTVYNEAFRQICGSKHPQCLGQSVTSIWPDVLQKLKDALKTQPQKLRASMEDESRFFVERGGADAPRETYLKWSIIPIVENNQCLGFIHPVLDTTSIRLWERRMKMLIDLGEVLVTARDVKSYWRKTIEYLGECSPSYDIPLAILYSVGCTNNGDKRENAPSSDKATTHTLRFEGALGVPEGHPITSANIRPWEADGGLAPAFRSVLSSEQPILLQTKDGTLPTELLGGLQWRGFGDPCRAAVVCPIRPTKEENVMGVLVLGINPRQPFDNDYQQYISLLRQKLATSLASTVLLEEEERRGRNAAAQAAYDQAMLKEKLALQAKETEESIQKFQAVAEFIPVGMCFGDGQGNITFANDAWYRITGHEPGPIPPGGFQSCVIPEDRHVLSSAHEQLQKDGAVTYEFRVKAKPQPLTHPPKRSTSFDNTGLAELVNSDIATKLHVLAVSKAERASDGHIIQILTCLTDVTAHKQAAAEAVRRAQQAENLKRMAEFATVGMYDMDLEGRLLSANNVFYELCGLDKVDLTKIDVHPFQTCVQEEDMPVLEDSLEKLKNEGKSQTAELRLRKPWRAEDSLGRKVEGARWVLATFMPVISSDGVIQSFTGCLSDVSLQKWQLELERERKEEALDSKRQQDNFIDMTSHEMRNPLSAIVHCSDAITASLARVQELGLTRQLRSVTEANPDQNSLKQAALKEALEEEKRLIEDGIDNAETIVACAQHQKRIVDDILTMSKLHSKLLAITPFTVNPIRIVQEALKMFEVEARRVDIDLSMMVDKSYQELGFEYLDFDPSRVKQVLINLLTNALKFTKSGPTRNVSVCMKGFRMRPTDETSPVSFINRSQTDEVDYEQPALVDHRDPVYLMFEVKDTGQGLTEDEMSHLFNRFVQASSRTHVKYGGSGLGLYISRRLTELQNGAIGVSSRPGVGSVFAFYIEAYVPSVSARKEAEAAAVAAARSTTLESNAFINLQHDEQGKPTKILTKLLPVKHLPSPVPNGLAVPLFDGILIVEDNLINQQITRRGLQKQGYRVVVANHGLEAMDKLKEAGGADLNHATDEKKPLLGIDLILMDIEMPIQDGLTCTRNIRELEKSGQVFCASGGRMPIIAVSANARMEQVLEALGAGCDDVLVKPYRMPELIEKMQMTVRRMRDMLPEHLPH